MFDMEKYLQDYSIPHKLRKSNMLTFECPFCDSSSGKHSDTGGWDTSRSRKTLCFRCGGRSVYEFIKVTSNLTHSEIVGIIREYETDPAVREELKEHPAELILPPEMYMLECEDSCKNYLKGRGFNPDIIIPKYNLKFTGYLGRMAHRLVIPIHRQGVMTSYTTRTLIHDPMRYISCPTDNEVVPHKSMLFNMDNANDTVVLVEAPFSVMKLGSDITVASFGTQISDAQINILKSYSKVFVCFDGEAAANAKSRKLVKILNYFCKAYHIDTETEYDIADFSINELVEFRKFLKLPMGNYDHILK